VAGKRPDGGGEAWQEALWSAGGVWYDCGKPAALRQRGATHVYLLNETGFVEAGAHGFRFMAVATPRVTEEDFTRWRQQEGTEREEEGEPQPGVTVRTFGQMADAACGVHRVGVLRMDVDNLGAIMGRGLKPRTLAATSALSRALDLFFAGWLNVLCGETNRKAREERPDEDRGDGLYAIYAGGDDLFVVGSWDLMPVLAARVHDDFKRYTCRNADLSISGGITLEDRKFPLYQAAERAGAAEEAAKAHRAGGSRKDAISFLGLAVKWAEWPEVEERMRKIVRLIQQEQVSKALIQILESIYAQYEAQIPIELERREKHGLPLPDEPASEVYYGPWMWHQAYALTRLAGRGGGKTAQAILDLQADALMPAPIRQSGLAARWAELITRKEREQ
jgi:CRISPR-associated protein Csm1